MSSRYVMDFAIEYIIMYVSTLFLNNFTLNILFVNSLYVNGEYVIVLKISADDIQGKEDSKWLDIQGHDSEWLFFLWCVLYVHCHAILLPSRNHNATQTGSKKL